MRRYKKKRTLVITVFCITVSAALCIWLSRQPSFNPGRIYHNDDLLVREQENFHAVNYALEPVDGDSGGRFFTDGFSGSRTVTIMELEERNSVSCTWNIDVKKGLFKIVLIDTQNARIAETICEGSGEGDMVLEGLPAGEYRVKFAADNAAVEGIFHIISD